MDFVTIKSKCNLSNIEVCNLENFAKCQDRFPNGKTTKQLGISPKKMGSLNFHGYVRKAGFCYTNNGKTVTDLFKIA